MQAISLCMFSNRDTSDELVIALANTVFSSSYGAKKTLIDQEKNRSK